MADWMKISLGIMGVTAMCIPVVFLAEWAVKTFVMPFLNWIDKI